MARKANFKTILARQKKFADKEVSQELRDTGLEMRTSHQHVVSEWQHKPTFKAEVNESQYLKTVTIKVKGEAADIWTFVDKGTKPHEIAAKNVPFLKFQTGYSARTAPVAKFNQGTGQSFGPWVSTAVVQHPGTEARKFTETILKELSPPIEERIQAAVKRGLDKGK